MAFFMLGWYLNLPRGPLNFRVSPETSRSMHWDILPVGYTCSAQNIICSHICLSHDIN